jgi:hypothetical protein
MPEVEQHGDLAYPLCDHLADKAVATLLYGVPVLALTRWAESLGATSHVAGFSSPAIRLCIAIDGAGEAKVGRAVQRLRAI